MQIILRLVSKNWIQCFSQVLREKFRQIEGKIWIDHYHQLPDRRSDSCRRGSFYEFARCRSAVFWPRGGKHSGTKWTNSKRWRGIIAMTRWKSEISGWANTYTISSRKQGLCTCQCPAAVPAEATISASWGWSKTRRSTLGLGRSDVPAGDSSW